jgi:hypothetical protein
MGVMDRARRQIPASGDYLDKENLVRDQEPMALVSVSYDERPSNTWGPRWVVTIQPWYEDQETPHGLLTFTALPTRNPVFEDLQAQIEENGNEPVGPVVLIREKSQKGFRYYTFSDFNEDGAGSEQPAVPVPAPAPRAARPAAPAPVETEPKPKRGRPYGSRNRPKEEPSATSTPVASPSKPAERAVAGTEQILAVGEAVCPKCQQVVRGRVLSDETGARVIIHAHCPVSNQAEVLQVSEEISA